MADKIGVGMIGCGGMGRMHAHMMVAREPRVEFRGFSDPSEGSIAEALKISPNARVYADYRELVQSPDIDWVMIASWNCFHREQAIAALEAGKNVFCQKPLATTLEDCVAMRDAWKASGRMFVIGFTLRFSPFYRKLKELIAGGTIGGIISMEFNETLNFNHGGYIMSNWRRLRKNAGTHLLEKCCHDVDLVNWMVESRAKRVASFGGLSFFRPENAFHAERIGKNAQGWPAYLTWPQPDRADPFTGDKDIIDNQVAIVEFESDVRTTFHTNCNSGIPERRMYILGTEGAIRADVIASTIEVQRIGFDTKRESVWDGVGGGHGGGDDILVNELIASMLEGTEPCVGMEEGLASSITCFAIDDAMDSGQVVDVRPYWQRAEV